MLKLRATVTTDGLDNAIKEALEKVYGSVDGALLKTANYVRNEAKATSRFVDKTGNLRRSIRRRKSKFINGGYLVIATGKAAEGKKGYHAHLVEFGHVKVLWGHRTGGRVAGRKFMEEAAKKGEAFLKSELGV